MKKLLSSVLTGIGILLGAILIFGMGAVGYLNTDPGRIHLLNALNRRIPGTVSASHLSFSLLSGRLDIRDLKLIDGFRKEAASCDRIQIFLSWLPLFHGTLRVRSAAAENVKARLEAEPDGTLNVSHIFSEPASEPPPSENTSSLLLPLVIERLTLLNAGIDYLDPQENSHICASGIDADLSADFPRSAGRADIRIGSGWIETPFLQTWMGPVTLSGRLKDDKIDPLQLHLTASGLDADISGSVSALREDPRIHCSVEIESMLPALRKSLMLITPLSGTVHLSGTLSGPIRNPDADLRLSSAAVSVSDTSIPGLAAEARLLDRHVLFEAACRPPDSGLIRVTGEADLKKAFSSGLFSQPADLSGLGGSFKIEVRSLNLSPLQKAATGVIDGRMTWAWQGFPGHGAASEIDLNLKASRLSLHPDAAPVTASIEANSRWDQSGLALRQLEASAGPTRLTASGFWDTASRRLSGELNCQSDNLSMSLSPLGIQGADGILDLHAGISGTPDQPEFAVRLKGRRLGFRDIRIGDLDADTDIGPSGILRITSLSLKNRESELSAKGEMPIYPRKAGPSAPITLTAAIGRVRPADFIPSPVLQGVFSGSLKLQGTEKSLSGSLQVQGEGLTTRDIRIGNVAADLHLSEGKVEIQRLSLQNRSSHADATGFVQVLEPGRLSIHPLRPFAVHISGAGLRIEDFTDAAKGSVSLTAEMAGTARQITGSAALASPGLDTGFQKWTDIRLAADYRESRLTVTNAHAAVAPGESLDGSGWISQNGAFHAALTAPFISLGHVDVLAKRLPEAGGRLSAAITATGSLDHPQITGQLLLDSFRFRDIHWDHTRLTVDMANHTARFSLDAPVRGTGTYQLDTRNYSAELEFGELALTPFFQAAGVKDMGGSLSGKISGSGRLGSFDSLNADAVFPELMLNYRKAPLLTGRNLQLSIRNDAVVIPQNRLALFQEGTLEIGGEARPGKSVALHLNADVPVAAAGHYTDRISDLRGRIVLSAAMKGTWYRPEIEAVADIQNAGLTMGPSSPDIHHISGRIRLTPAALFLESITGQLDSGSVTLNGKAGLDVFHIRDLDIQMTAAQVPIRVEDTLDVQMNADLRLNGSVPNPLLHGEIDVMDGLYYKNISLNPIRALLQRERGYQGHQGVVFPPIIQNMRLDVRIPPRGRFVVDNNVAQLNLSPDMRIIGTLQRPVIMGRTQIDSGTLQYQSTTFTISKGFVDFTNPYTLEYVLDIQSQTTIQSWTVFLDISGPMEKLNLKLSSSPVLDDNDLLALLLTGKTARAAITTPGAGTSGSSKLMADMISAAFGSDLKKASGLDILEVDTTGDGRLANEDPLKVTFGKIISPQITLKYSVENTGGITFQRAIAEYMLVENILLSGFQDSRGVFGGEIKYRHEFR